MVDPFTSGTKITVRPSLRPLATSNCCSAATRLFVPMSAEFVSTREVNSRARPPRSTIDTVAVPDSGSPVIAYRVKPFTDSTAASNAANTFNVS
ncbi:unannotated protein [freshwater metagenome]|uniref:Unannotated protein n=1 Tax=freshwater metagenome TaxID=449393 RepID=A0A6J6LGS2_9ZZZZ